MTEKSEDNKTTMNEDFDRYVKPFETDYDKNIAFSTEMAKVALSQMFTLNWSAIIAVPAFVSLTRSKQEIIQITKFPMACFAIGIFFAIGCTICLFKGFTKIAENADENANLWTEKIIKSHTGTHPIDQDINNPIFAGSAKREKASKKAASAYFDASAILGILSFLALIAGSAIFAYLISAQ